MKVLFLQAYFKPERTSGAHLGEDFRKALADAGHSMYLYAPTPTRGVSEEVRREYSTAKKKEMELDGALRVRRFALYREGTGTLRRALRYILLELQLLWFGLRTPAVEVLSVSSTPPINGLMAILLKKLKGIPYVYTIQDMFPESLVSTGIAKKGSLPWKIGNWVSNVTYRNAEHIIVICDSMKKTLIEKGVPAEKITVAYNWIDTEATFPVSRQENPLFAEFNLDPDAFYVTYAGNLGNSQNVELLVDCAEALKEESNIRFVIFGSGTEEKKLQERIKHSGLTNIVLLPLQPIEKVSQVYSLGDVSFILCKKGVGAGAFPSKAASILATGTPIIASFDLNSDLCKIIQENGVGLCADAEDVEGAVAAIRQLCNDRERCAQMSNNARTLAGTRFSKETGTAARVAVYETAAKKAKKKNA